MTDTKVHRLRPPGRRDSRTLKIRYADMSGLRLDAHVNYSTDTAATGGSADTGHIVEVFITAGTPGHPSEAAMRDMGVLLSLALQHGVTLEQLAASVSRGNKDEPAGPLAVVVDALLEEERNQNAAH